MIPVETAPSPSPLSPHTISAFHRDGFTVLERVTTPDQIVADYGTKYQAVHNDPMFQTMGASKFFKLLADVEGCIAQAPQQAQKLGVRLVGERDDDAFDVEEIDELR